MIKIPLTQGKVAIIDNKDFELVRGYKWRVHKDLNTFYAIAHASVSCKITTVRMHRVILGLTDPKIKVDHINGNGLDNQRENLRACSHSENLRNRGKTKANKSGYKGVSWHKQKWRSQINIKGKVKHLGYYTTPQEAHAAYCAAAELYHGEFANTGE